MNQPLAVLGKRTHRPTSTTSQPKRLPVSKNSAPPVSNSPANRSGRRSLSFQIACSRKSPTSHPATSLLSGLSKAWGPLKQKNTDNKSSPRFGKNNRRKQTARPKPRQSI